MIFNVEWVGIVQFSQLGLARLLIKICASQDLRLALGLAESVSQSTPIAAAANELYKVAKSHGLSDEDFSAVIEALKAKTAK